MSSSRQSRNVASHQSWRPRLWPDGVRALPAFPAREPATPWQHASPCAPVCTQTYASYEWEGDVAGSRRCQGDISTLLKGDIFTLLPHAESCLVLSCLDFFLLQRRNPSAGGVSIALFDVTITAQGSGVSNAKLRLELISDCYDSAGLPGSLNDRRNSRWEMPDRPANGCGRNGERLPATHLGTTRVVAVKVIAPRWAAEPQFLARFQREAQACGRLRHPNIVNVTDRAFQTRVTALFRSWNLLILRLPGRLFQTSTSRLSGNSIEILVSSSCESNGVRPHRLGLLPRHWCKP